MLAFSNDYYGFIFRATQSVELFCAYDDTVQELRKLAEKCTVEKASSSLLETAEFIDDFWQEY